MNHGRDAFVAASERLIGSHMTPTLRARLMTADLQALQAQTQDRPSIADVLPTMARPCLLFAGETDLRFPAVHRCAQQLSKGSFFCVPGCGHFAAWARSDVVLPHVTTFLAQGEHTELQRPGPDQRERRVT